MIKLLSELAISKLKIATSTAKLGIKVAQLKVLKALIRKKNK